MSKFGEFWQELKRRRVIHVITVYATAAFVLIELVGNLTDPLNLPPNLSTIVIIVLAVGFPLAIILSWIYDVTSDGVEKTKPLEEIREDEKSSIPNAWKIATYVSFVAIIGLVTFNIVRGTKGLRPGDIQSLAILPFDNLTGDEQLDWAAAGMQSSLIGDMGRVSGLRVPGITTSNAFKETDMTATALAQELNVDALVEGTLTCYGEMVCIQFRAIITFPEEKQLWQEDYMVAKSEILNLYSRIINKMAHEMRINLTQQGETWLAETRTVDPDAYDAFLQGRILLDQFNPPSFQTAIDSFTKAIELEPDWAAPYAGIAEVGSYQRQIGIGSESDIIMMYDNLNTAIELDPNSPEAHHAKAVIAAWTEFDWEKAEKEFVKAIDLNPSSERSHSFYAHVLSTLRRTDEALYHGKLAQELEPENPFTLVLYGVVMMLAVEYQSAIMLFENALAIDPNFGFAAGWLKIAQLQFTYVNGDYEKWFELWNEKVKGRWNDEGRKAVLNAFYEKGHIAGIEEMFKMNEKYGNEICLMDDQIKLERYLKLGDYDKVMDYYEIIYENNNHDPNLPYISAKSTYDKMKGNQRYLALLEKMNLPVSE